MGVFNQFGVGVLGDKVVILMPPTRPLTNREALELAAYLVCMTLLPISEFKAVLEEVQE